jgi:hypothetical protein
MGSTVGALFPESAKYARSLTAPTVLTAVVSIACAAVFIALSMKSPELFSRTSFAVVQATAPISYAIADGRNIGGFDPGDRELAEMAFDAWSRESGRRLKFVRADDPSTAQFRLQWVAAGEGRFGETQRISVGGKAGAIVYVSTADGLGDPLASLVAKDRLLRDSIVYLTCVHEIGHAVGLEHTRNFEDIMYSFGYGGDIVKYFYRYRDNLKSRSDIPRFSGLSTNDIAVLKSLY